MTTHVRFRLAGGAQPLLLVPAVVNGTARGELILDTGASPSYVSVMVSELVTSISQEVEADLDGILGYNFLREFRVTIDYPRKMLRLE